MNARRTIARLVLSACGIALACLALCVAWARPARAAGSASLEEGVYQLASVARPSLVLDVQNGSSATDARVQLWPKNGELAQKWELSELSDGSYGIRNTYTGLYLSDSGDGMRSRPSLDSSSKWRASADGDDVVLTNVKTGGVLGVSGGDASEGSVVDTSSADGSDAQSWSLVSVPLLQEGCYAFLTRSAGSQALDVPSALPESGLNIHTYALNESVAQQWQVEEVGDGWYSIVNVGSGLPLDVRGGSASIGSILQQSTPNGTDGQLWKFVTAPSGGIAIVSKLGNYALTPKGMTAYNGCQVILAPPQNDDCFSWNYIRYSTAEDVGNIWGDDAYVDTMRAKAEKWGNTTERPTEFGIMPGEVTGWCCTVDLQAARVCIFRQDGSSWNLVQSYNAYVGAYNSKRGYKSNTFSGVWSIRHKSRALWDEAWGGINCNDWFTCFIEAWSPVPTSYANRYFPGKGYDDGQGFHYVSYNDGFWHRTQGCTGLTYEESKWVYDNVPLETPVVVFDWYDYGAY